MSLLDVEGNIKRDSGTQFLLRALVIATVIYFVCSLTSCMTTNNTSVVKSNRTETDLPLYYVDSELVPYLASFKTEAHAQGFLVSAIPVTMIFSRLRLKDSPKDIGLCSNTTGRLLIKIDRQYYFKHDPSHREELVYHELAHCLASREHCNYVDLNTKRRVSIMSEEMGDDSDYKEHRDEYIKELFHVHPNCL